MEGSGHNSFLIQNDEFESNHKPSVSSSSSESISVGSKEQLGMNQMSPASQKDIAQGSERDRPANLDQDSFISGALMSPSIRS